mmetsp:Transcript_2327/g.15487  ORF Transcript_2327/g.15487 Transcript_2327/m.15487 type:complete len:98 (-) Transcript_2327:1657-1950(-)
MMCTWETLSHCFDSWDVIEPITYFMWSFVLVGMYAFSLHTKREFSFENFREFLIKRSRKRGYRRAGLDLNKYRALCRRLHMTQKKVLEANYRQKKVG